MKPYCTEAEAHEMLAKLRSEEKGDTLQKLCWYVGYLEGQLMVRKER